MTAVTVQSLHACEFCKLETENARQKAHIEEQNTEIERLKRQLGMLRERAVETEALFQRLQQWEMMLLGVGSLERLLDSMTGDLRERFQIDQARLLLTDRDHRIRGLLEAMGARVPEDVLFEQASADLQQLRQPRLIALDEQALPPLFPPGGPIRSIALLPLVREQRFLGLLALGSQDTERYGPELETHCLARLAAICSVCLENAINSARLELGGLTDPLTGLHNRRSLEQRLHAEIERARRDRQSLSCLFLDLDLFKQINDAYGHSAGDQVLREVARRLKTTLRAGDIAARFGGDELALLLPATDYQDARDLAERIRDVVTSQPLDLEDGASIQIGLSIGVGALASDQLSEDAARAGQDLVQAADAALYQAKRGGRGRVV
jgi:diguanylate cyclase (GGDEF)-like protein